MKPRIDDVRLPILPVDATEDQKRMHVALYDRFRDDDLRLTSIESTLAMTPRREKVGFVISPLTTKGDLYTYSSLDIRLAVGTNGQYLRANSAAATGLAWTTIPISDLTGFGTGIATALAVNVGTAGAPVINGGALGTPSSGVATNLTGTAAGLTAGTVTTNANLTGEVTSIGNATTIAAVAWATATPTVSASSGTITTASAALRYKAIGKTCAFTLVVTVTTNNTGATTLIVSALPFTTASTGYVGSGRCTAGSGFALQWEMASTTSIGIKNYDNTYPAADGYVLIVNGVVELA